MNKNKNQSTHTYRSLSLSLIYTQINMSRDQGRVHEWEMIYTLFGKLSSEIPLAWTQQHYQGIHT